GPALQAATGAEVEVVMRAGRVMLLDEVAPSLAPFPGPLRLRRLVEPPLRAIGFERGAGLARRARFPRLGFAWGHSLHTLTPLAWRQRGAESGLVCKWPRRSPGSRVRRRETGLAGGALRPPFPNDARGGRRRAWG